MAYRRICMALVSAALPVFAVSANAQEGGVIRNASEIQSCVCQEQSVAALNSDVQTQSHAYEEKRQNFEALDKQVQSSRSQVNVNNAADIEAFKRLLQQRDAAADGLAGDATTRYTDVVTRYNQAVAAYNGTCAGKPFDADMLAAARRTPNCPKP